ncbi:ADP-ribosylglycohydrolase family protein [Fibrella forsythiae]|uniref:ADP-ribosylglycohydrolase family protein n=1 Tax=Fibrella forsythiae TaxID=2817061 RepID=A0ABS3JEB4_9BACT|nr:ADP-ribosylglycohydrolase family protein [Fibrella forsythiae]MBO0948349.1 ADP-ribosylglycohydrolase family protein [Fibrella forsythiae]
MSMMVKNKITDALLGLAVGDALGVPVEFMGRAALKDEPVATMKGYGTHQQPPGTWSDDSSLAFCLAESLCGGYRLSDLTDRFVNWYQHGYWTPYGQVFDIGIATSIALHKVATGTSPLQSGGAGEQDNGNGSLMRILPLVFYLRGKPIEERFRLIGEVSGITHLHIRSVFACFIYCEYALLLMDGLDKYQAFRAMQERVNEFVKQYSILDKSELDRFHRLLENPVGNYEIRSIMNYEEAEISSSGYVLHTLEASFWCFLNTNTYAEAVLKAINLGSDTDTTGCVTGGIAGLYYEATSIPQEWIDVLARKDDIITLSNRLNDALPYR